MGTAFFSVLDASFFCILLTLFYAACFTTSFTLPMSICCPAICIPHVSRTPKRRVVYGKSAVKSSAGRGGGGEGSWYTRPVLYTEWEQRVLHLYGLPWVLCFSGHFILVENTYSNQPEATAMSLLLKFCQNVSQGNQSIHFYKKNLKLLMQPSILPRAGDPHSF